MNKNVNNAGEIACEEVTCIVCGKDKWTVTARGYDYEYRISDQSYQFVRCECCGHEYLNPRPTLESIRQIYPDNYYTLAGRHSDSGLIPVIKRFVVGRRLGYFDSMLRNGGRVFEVGCGDCSLLMWLKENNPEIDVSGIDLAFSNSTKKKCQELGIEVIEGNIERLTFDELFREPDVLDLVIMNQLIEHLIDPDQVIGKLAKAIKPGGYISIETPDGRGYDRRFFKESFWGGYYFPRHLHLFDADSLGRMLNKYSLTTEKKSCLVAPIIWAFSFHAKLCQGTKEGWRCRVLSAFFSDRNPVCLGFFTVVDLIARLFGLTTSNQKIIARKG